MSRLNSILATSFAPKTIGAKKNTAQEKTLRIIEIAREFGGDRPRESYTSQTLMDIVWFTIHRRIYSFSEQRGQFVRLRRNRLILRLLLPIRGARASP